MKRFIKYLLIVLIVSLTQKAIAQSFPVNITPAIHSPYSPYLSDYVEPGSQKLQVTVQLKDPTLPEYRCKFRLTVEGVGITIRTRQNFIPQPTILQGGGVPNILYGEDLAEYFNPANLDFAGISKANYTKGAKLPEGIYRFSFEVLDYNRGTTVSNKGFSIAWIILNDPVLLNLPQNNDKVKILDPTNIAFTWTPRHTGSPNSAFTTEYIFRLIELWPANRNPYDAFLSQQPLYETTTNATQIVYGPAEPALIPGRKYAWQVQTRDVDGRDLFKNDGKSEVYIFQYGSYLGIPENLRQDYNTGNSSVLILRWQPAGDGAAPEQYRLRYRKKGTEASGIWYEEVSDQLWERITDLQPDTEYEVQIRSEAKPQYSDYSGSVYFHTEKKTAPQYECGKEDTYIPSGNTTPLMALVPGDTITMRGFKLRVEEVTGGHGNYTGKGWMQVPWFNGAWVHVSFSGPVNEFHEMYGGSFESIHTPGGRADQLLEKAHRIGEKPVAQKKSGDSTSIAIASDYTIPGTIDTVYIEDGKIITIDTDGNKSTFEPKKDERTGKAKETVIADAVGNSYTVGADGKVTKKDNPTQATGGAAVADYSGTKEAKLIAEIVKRFSNQLASKITSVRSPIFPKGAGPMADIFSYAPTCMPDNQEQLKITKSYTDKIENNKDLLNKLVSSVFKNQSAKEAITELAKGDLKDNQKFVDILTKEQLQEAEDVLCPYVAEAAKQEFLESWWRAPYWERAAKILKEQFEDQDLYDDVYLVYGENECKTIAILKISEDASITTEVTFSSKQSDVDIFHILHDTYKVDYLEARDITLESFGEWFWNYMAIKDDKLYHGTSWEAKSLVFFADMLMAAPGTIEGWITGKHWRTGEELAMWEHVLGILDVIPAEAFAKAGVTALVIKIGSKVIDISKFSQPVKNFISTAYKSGLKLMIKSKDEILIFAGASKKQIGRLLNRVLQDIYWKYGGERILAKLANVQYLDDNTKKVVEGTLEIVEEGKEVGVRIADDVSEITTDLVRSGEDFTVLANARRLPGTATGNGKSIIGQWLRGTERNAGLFPKSVADKLKGKQFKNFDEFREAFWKEVANEPSLASQFEPQQVSRMKEGGAPFVRSSQQLGGQRNYVLHHKTPINQGGGVYDMDNLYIVTPKYHKEILDPAYHYGYGY
jgi:hypothetical protein